MAPITTMTTLLAAAEYSLLYILMGGGLFGAFVVYLLAKMMRK